MECLEFVLKIFGKKEACIAAIIGDNANVNRALTLKFRSRFVDGHRHRFDLTVKEY